MLKHFNILVYGRVQGVFFRASAKEQAESLGVTGIAENHSGGFVNIEVEGEEANLQKFVEWCKTGSRQALVERVETAEEPMKNYREFKIAGE